MLKKSILKIMDITLDITLYPRIRPLESVINRYAKELKRGDVFPRVYVGKFKGKYYLIDGRHRLEANKMNGEKYIACEINEHFPDWNSMFLAAIRSNDKHGRQLSQQDRHKIAIRLSEMKYDFGDIVKLTGVSLKKIESSVTGKIRHSLIKAKVAKKEIAPTIKEKVRHKEEIPIVSREDLQIETLKDILEYVSTAKFSTDKRIENLVRKIKKKLHKRFPKL